MRVSRAMKALIIKVTNVQEDGSVSILPVQPAIGQVVTATLTDEDGEITGAKWQWSSSGTETDGLHEHRRVQPCRPTRRASQKRRRRRQRRTLTKRYAGDEGKFLRATVTYKDGATLEEDDENDQTTDDDESAADMVMKETTNAVREVPDVNSAPYFMR